jgi:hypothetical protein
MGKPSKDPLNEDITREIPLSVIYPKSHNEGAASNRKRRLTEYILPANADSFDEKNHSTLGAVMFFTSPGMPMIFHGQEILEWMPLETITR